MRSIVVGLGVQGHKRRRFAGDDYVASVDPLNSAADFRTIEDASLDSFDAALCCVPDAPKFELLAYLLANGKHVLVEKPLQTESSDQLIHLQDLARRSGVMCYTAYNHRFEPHFVTMRDLIASGELGRIYSCRMFYGNGTAQLVRESRWRDEGAGVLPDLGSHLLDTCRFWFGDIEDDFDIISSNRFENRAPDHVVVSNEKGACRIELEMTLLSWRNHFTCDIFAEHGSAHIESLCKWGPSTFVHRKRIRPSGRPPEEAKILVQEDPTWAAEYAYFKQLCQSGTYTDLSNDIWLQESLGKLSRVAVGSTGKMSPPQ
ncbi:Gfo/Idh/MocA family protein [Labrys neptuniae]